jgi:hypothetical protein
VNTEAEVVIEKCREKWRYVSELEKEEDGHKDRAKQLRKTIENTTAEIRRLLTENNQTELELRPTSWSCAGCGDTFSDSPGETHAVKVPTVDGGESAYDCGPVRPVVASPEAPGPEPAAA